MALELYAPGQAPVEVEITPDFSSFLADIDENRVAGTELTARLEAIGGLARVAGVPVVGTEGFVREERVLTSGQKSEVLREAEAVDEVFRQSAQGRNYERFYDDILGRKIRTEFELNARLSAKRGTARTVLGQPIVANGEIIEEDRMVDASQAETLSALFQDKARAELVIENAENARRLSNTIFRAKPDELFELKARVNSVAGRANTEGGLAIVSQNGIIQESRTINPEQKTILDELIDDKMTIDDFATQADDFNKFLQDILAKRISGIDELEVRLGISANGRTVPTLDAKGNDPQLDTRKVNPVQASQLRAVVNSLEELDDDTLRLAILQSLVREGDFEVAERLVEERIKIAPSQEAVYSAEASKEIVESINQVVRTCVLTNQVGRAIVDRPDDLEGTLEIIGNTEQKGIEEKLLGDEVRALAFRARRLAETTKILRLNSDAQNKRDFDKIFEDIRSLRDSPSDLDKVRASKLIKLVYAKELATKQLDLLDAARLPAGDLGNLEAEISSLDAREDEDGFSYFEEQQAIIEQARAVARQSRRAIINRQLAGVVGRFKSSGVDNMLGFIEQLPDETDSDFGLKENVLAFYKQYLYNRRDRRAEDCGRVLAFEISAVQRAINESYDFDEELGRNIEAFKLLATNFKNVMTPLLQALRSDPAYQEKLQKLTSGGKQGRDFRNQFIQRVERLSEQRELTQIEEAYLNSVELLSLFNPHLAELIDADPAISQVYLESYFASQTEVTWDALQDDELIPIVQVGLGPNGLATAGEILRKRPDLAGLTLYVDNGELPGGPFAVPKGPAWDLNSANARGIQIPTLPSEPGQSERETVRAFGSPLRWYPGERNGSDVRQGSINSTVDYLITPDGISDARYPDNEDMALVLQVQTAMVANRICLKTDVVSVQPAPEDDSPYRMRITLSRQFADGTTEEKTVRVDNFIPASGLGAPSFGFNLRGSSAERVMEATNDLDIFPKISDTLTAFKALASREGDAKMPGKTIAIYGNGNSADTLLEYIGALFNSGNRDIRNIEKVYVITEGELSDRPRYASILDIRPRNGQGNLVELVSGRVSDVGFTFNGGDVPVEERRLILSDERGRNISTSNGLPVIVDNVIAATGFRPRLGELLSGISNNPSLRGDNVVRPLTLPTDMRIPVADTLVANPRVLIVGTASDPNFTNPNKLAQLPALARQALLRNGSENAVAIGFRAPDTQAGVRLFLEDIPISTTERPKNNLRFIPIVSSDDITKVARVPKPARMPKVRGDIAREDSMLTPLFLRGVSNIRFTDEKKMSAGQSMIVTLSQDEETGEFVLRGDNYISGELLQEFAIACADPFFQAYATKEVVNRRGSSDLRITFNVKNGRIDQRKSYVEAV